MGSMVNLLILSIVVFTAHAKPVAESYAEGYEYHPEYQNYYVSPVIAAALPPPQASQHHAQDELGQYEYGFNTGNSAKHELKTADGVTRGSYSYVDANGILQTTNYISDDVFGFRVAATNLPQHVVPSQHAPVAPVHLQPVAAVAPVENAEPVAVVKAADILPAVPATVASAPAPHVVAPTVAYSYLPYALNYGYSAALPQVVANYAATTSPVVQQPVQTPVHVATPNVVSAPALPTQTVVLTPAVPTTHQFHAQDELGQYQFGYTEPQASRIETKTADGVVTGRYNYIDSNGLVQTVEYIADALGFRVAGTNIPQHVVAAPVAAGVAPQPVVDTPEVIAAREAHLQLVQEAKSSQPVVVAQQVVEVAEPKIIAVPNIVPEEANVDEVIPEYDTIVDTPVVKVETKVLEPYVPPPVATFYKPADPVKVAAAVEQQLGGVDVAAPVGNIIVPTPLSQLSYTVGHAAPVAAPIVSAPISAPVIAQPQVYLAHQQVALATPPVATHQVPVVAAPVFVPPFANQHHAQDEYGQYQYGYTNEDSAKLEQRLADGSVRGTYSYIDANGVVQRVDYISDALGFRVAATNIPVHTPCVEGEDCSVAPAPVTPVVAPAPAAPVVIPAPSVPQNVYTPVQPVLQQIPVNEEVVGTHDVPLTAVVTPNVAPIPYYVNPAPVAVTPTVQQVPYASQYGYQQIQYVPAVPTTSQHHAQSEFGEYNYGYSNQNSAKTEVKTIDGVTRGSYTYVDANNIVQRVDYIADDLFGFRVAATNLPVAPAPVPVAAPALAPEVVAPEVDSNIIIEE